jgi:hypothetical protein
MLDCHLNRLSSSRGLDASVPLCLLTDWCEAPSQPTLRQGLSATKHIDATVPVKGAGGLLIELCGSYIICRRSVACEGAIGTHIFARETNVPVVGFAGS